MDYISELEKEEKYRNESPCCHNCRAFYMEYGYELCKVHKQAEENIMENKCDNWR